MRAHDQMNQIDKKQIEQMQRIFENESKLFATYGTLFEGLDLSKRSAILYNLIFFARRLILCYVAMFLGRFSWLQIIIFVVCSQLNLLYLAYAAPFEDTSSNFIEQVNEQFIFLIGVLSMCLIGLAYTVEDRDTQGHFMTGIIYTKLLINLFFIIRQSFKPLKQYWKKRLASKKQNKKKEQLS